MFNGCEVDRDTGALLSEAAFTELALHEIDTGPADLYLPHRITRVATNGDVSPREPRQTRVPRSSLIASGGAQPQAGADPEAFPSEAPRCG